MYRSIANLIMAKFIYIYELTGIIMANGFNSTEDIEASCQEEAKAILESFYDGEYELLWTDNNDERYDEEFPDYEWIERNIEIRKEMYDSSYYDQFGSSISDNTYDDKF